MKISDICEIKRGRVINKQEILKNQGIYPVYSSQTENNGELGKISTYDFDGEYVTWTTDGAKAGTVFHRKGKFSITNVCGLLKPDLSVINPKYLYYSLSIVAPNYVNKIISNAKLMSNTMAEIKIKIPPLSVQNKVVHILDNFETICKDLKIVISVEENKRQKQYEYYLNFIFKQLSIF